MHKTSLFSRLLTYFIIVMLIPVGFFVVYYVSWGDKNLLRSLKQQASLSIKRDSADLAEVLESYRHKAYLISTDPMTINILKQDNPQTDSLEARNMYIKLFNIMKGDTYLAFAHMVSNSGNVRFSTHDFPTVYDLRFHNNEWEQENVLSLSQAGSQTASIISIRGRTSSENGKPILITILRRVYDSEGDNLGYVIVEVLNEAISPLVNKDMALSEEVLVDASSYWACSTIHANQVGSFDKFPNLAAIKGDFSNGVSIKNNSVTAITPIKGTDLLLAGTISSTPYAVNMKQLLVILLLALGIGSLMAVVLSFLFSRSISKPIKKLATSMKAVEEGNIHIQIGDAKIRELSQLNHSFNAMVLQITSLLDLTREEEAKLAEAERMALESQMNPHFLFNTLNTIKALARMHNEDQIYIITIKLGKLLRSTIDNHESECSIAESMALVDSYLTIQKIRFGEKLHVKLNTPQSCNDIMTPKLIIQPMVENAIVHGLEPKSGEWNLCVDIHEENELLTILIKDDGVGFDRSKLPLNLDELEKSTHVGLYNIYRRLKLSFGDKASFLIESKPGEGTMVKMTMPSLHRKTAEGDDLELQ
ncbi:MAG: sensor histidine kinase [Sphaerochaetaceae bacterium]